ncbi:MAG: hypothetical protein QF475_01795, partial [Candidatus Undinarchaeales archaeon]|nr:hypothetical protein [Candidatus Undinarchaeales archaeon]
MTNVSISKLLITFMVVLAMIAVPAYAAADARVVSLTFDPNPIGTGLQSELTIRVDNLGPDSATDAVVSYDITDSATQVVSTGTQTISLANAEVQDLAFTWTPTVSGTYTATATITELTETDPTSNTGTTNVDVVDTILIETFDATDVVTTDSLLYTTQPITFTGTVKKNQAGLATTVTFDIEGVGIIGSVNSAANGEFTYTFSSGLQFQSTGTKTVTARFYDNNQEFTETDTMQVVASNPSGDGLVDMTISPTKLSLEPGDVFDYLIAITSVNDAQGTYRLVINTHHEFEYSLSPESNLVALRSGEREDISLFVNVPNDAEAKNYPITIKLEDLNGRLIDLETVQMEILDVGQGDGTPSGTDYDVEVNLEPQNLEIKSGHYREFDIYIHNKGDKADTFDISYRTSYNIEHWFELEDEKITLGPGKSKYVSLFVDVPLDAIIDTYEVKVVVESAHSTDIEKSNLVVTQKDNYFDLSLDKPVLSPTGFDLGSVSDVDVTAAITLSNLKSIGGRRVTVKLYVDNRFMETQDVYISSGEEEEVKFTIDAEESPINGESGDYSIYYTASISGEYERSKTVDLEIRGMAEPSLTLDPEIFETGPNGTIAFTMRVHNPLRDSQTYLIYAKGLDLSFSPSSITVLPDETQAVAITGTLSNAPSGIEAVDIYISNANGEQYGSVTVTVLEADKIINDGVQSGGVTGYILTTAGGITAVIVALLLLVAVVGYYYYSRQDEDVIEGIDDQGNETVSFGSGGDKPSAPTSGSAGSLLSRFKKTFKAGA